MKTQDLVLLSLLLALSSLLGLVEQWLWPGLFIKIGLANIVSMMVLCLYSHGRFILFQLARVLIVFLLSGSSGLSLWISLSGTLCASLILLMAYPIKGLSLYGLSSLSAFFHVIGQTIIILFVYQQMGLIAWVPIYEVISLMSSIVMATLARRALAWIVTNTSMVCRRSNVV